MSELVGHDESVIADKCPSGGPDSLLTIGSERNVGYAGVLPTQGPLRLAMSGDEDARG